MMAYNTFDDLRTHGRICVVRAHVTAHTGGLVLSLDFELEWGVRDTLAAGGGYRDALLGGREAVPRMLDVFDAYGVAATWATVGFLFAESREELEAYAPTVRPRYLNEALNPYTARLGEGERDDPIHYAPSLLREIAGRPRQEIGSHTFSHYYCLEPGQTAGAFDADLASAVALARARGVELRSLVFPRNQVRSDYLPVVARHGFRAFRGPEPGLPYRARSHAEKQAWLLRGARLLDAYLNLSGSGAVDVPEASAADQPVNVAGSRFLRPVSATLRLAEPLRIRRIVRGMRAAAAHGQFYHLWWHPHNFGRDVEDNFAALDTVLRAYLELRDRYGFPSYAMHEVAETAPHEAPAAQTS